MATAAKKTVAVKTAAKSTKPPVTTALVKWDEEMAAAAQRGMTAEKPTGGFSAISTRGGLLAVDGTPVPDNELRAVVIAFAHENQYFTGTFDPATPAVPACYSFGDTDAAEPENGMSPHAKAKEPQGDANGLCAGCWANAMGSAAQGKGKACKNVRRLLVVTEDALESAEALEAAEVRMLKVPVMSVRGWGMYVHKVGEELKRPVWGVVTKIKVVPDVKSQFRVTFAFEELLTFDQTLVDAMRAKVRECSQQIVAPYPDLAAAPPPPTPRGRPLAPPVAAKQAAPARKTVPIVPVRTTAPAAKKPKY